MTLAKSLPGVRRVPLDDPHFIINRTIIRKRAFTPGRGLCRRGPPLYSWGYIITQGEARRSRMSRGKKKEALEDREKASDVWGRASRISSHQRRCQKGARR